MVSRLVTKPHTVKAYLAGSRQSAFSFENGCMPTAKADNISSLKWRGPGIFEGYDVLLRL